MKYYDFDLGRFKLKNIRRYSSLESFIITLLFLGIGYWIDSKDPALINSKLNVSLIIVSFITLFHGLMGGLISVFTISLILYYWYPKFAGEAFNNEVFFQISLFALLLGEFHSAWQRRIGKKLAEAKYLREKLDQLSTAFYSIKISHDQLEKHYILQPITIRSSIGDIKQISREDKDKSIEVFVKYLAKTFTIVEYGIYNFDDRKDTMTTIFETTKNLVDKNDLLLKEGMQKRCTIFVSDTSDKIKKQTNLLAIIPIIEEEIHIKQLFIIKDMPFMLFNKDILIKISILIFYFFHLLDKELTIKNLPINLDFLQDISKYEFYKLYKLYQKFQLNSSIIIFRITDDYIYKKISKLISKSARSLDVFSLKRYKQTFIITVILPFAQIPAAEGFTKRILEEIEKEKITKHFEKNTIYEYFTLADVDEMQQFIGVDKYD